ncbi:hypothetical protein YC2023_096379 [Brassica napus]
MVQLENNSQILLETEELRFAISGTVIPHLNFSISFAVLAPLFKFEEGLATSWLVRFAEY